MASRAIFHQICHFGRILRFSMSRDRNHIGNMNLNSSLLYNIRFKLTYFWSLKILGISRFDISKLRVRVNLAENRRCLARRHDRYDDRTMISDRFSESLDDSLSLHFTSFPL